MELNLLAVKKLHFLRSHPLIYYIIYYHGFVFFVVSLNEKEELADLRQRTKKLERQNANLQKEVDQLLKFKKNCLANHHNIKTEKVQKSESNDPYRHDGTIVLL